MWVPEVDFATRLRLVRRGFGRQRGAALTQGDMAELAGVPKNRWQQWEAGLAYPRDLVSVARKIAEVTGVDIAWLIGLGEFDFTPDGGVKTYSRWIVGIPGDGGDPPPFLAPGTGPGPKSHPREVIANNTGVCYGNGTPDGCITALSMRQAA